MESLKNKVAIVTGSSSGIGEGTAVLFAKLGCHLTLTGRDQDRLKAVVQRCVEAGCPADKIVTVTGNIQDKAVRQELLDKTVATFGRVDILVNNAGTVLTSTTTQTTEQQYDEIMDINTKSIFFLSKLIAPELIKTKGSIVNVSSIASEGAMSNHTAYCMTKAALDMFTKCLALELARSGVRVNSVNPGLVITNIHTRGPRRVTPEQFAKFVKYQEKVYPLGRVGQPEDIANAIAFLASDMSRFITGTIVHVDGGRLCGKL